MCGLVGLKTVEKWGITSTERDEFKMMMMLNALRGSHSTGIAGVASQKEGQVNLIKSVSSPYTLFSYAQSDAFMGRVVTQFDTLIGHGRYATRGKIDAPNAHPYEEGHITLAHNGVISNYHALRDVKRHANIDVDSHLIAKLFEEEGAIETLEQIEGAYVFMWYNAIDKSFNVARNTQRPLFIGKTKGRKSLMMASEMETLMWNQMRNKTEFETIAELPPFQIHTYMPDDIEAIVTEYTPYVPKPRTATPSVATHMNYGTKAGSREKLKASGRFKVSDELIVDSLDKDVTIKVGELVEFEVYDYSIKEGYLYLYGYNDSIPTVKFRVTQKDDLWFEEDILKYMSVRATVSAIYANMSDTDPEVAFSCFVIDAELVRIERPEIELDGEEMVTIVDQDGVIETIARFRLAELADKGCAWSECAITTEMLVDTKQLLYHNDGQYTGIVCPDCAREYLKSMAIVH
jgi:predicted glutamine amidotransferase